MRWTMVEAERRSRYPEAVVMHFEKAIIKASLEFEKVSSELKVLTATSHVWHTSMEKSTSLAKVN